MSKHFVYILECGDGSLYTGYTVDPKRRLRAHKKGQGAQYTRGRGPLKVVYLEKLASKSEGLKREYAIKQLTRAEKKDLIQSSKKTSLGLLLEAWGS
ncbi:MAG: GIY-YIG nuclease family protein [Tissierellia bacterium]|nr:GIY-YIG nuclease family protein [Tissierellia bacterium]